jgi:hypothetical protein
MWKFMTYNGRTDGGCQVMAGPSLSDFLKINKPQLLCENVFVKCKILPIFEKKLIL